MEKLTQQTWFDTYLKGWPLEKIAEYRHKCRTDLFFLAKELGYSDLTEQTHKEVCDFFLSKDFSKSFKEFAQTDSTSHDRLLLLPRGGFKSSIDVADCIQYILNWPDITILLLTGVYDLAVDFLREAKNHFVLQEDGTPKVNADGKFNLFQCCFYEFCTTKADKAETFTSPMRKANVKEPTLMAAGVETSMSGWHFDVIKSDDSVTNENSRTTSRLKTIKGQLAMHRKMLHPYGYCDCVGTWYAVNDAYGETISAEEKNGTLIWNAGRADSQDTDERQAITCVMLRPAMWPKPGKENVPDDQLTEQDWIIWFPERISYKWLMREKSKNPETFATQCMNNPLSIKRVKFNRESLIKATKPYTAMPQRSVDGFLVQVWDTAFKDNAWCDYSVGITALFYEGLIYILDITRGQFSEAELPQIIANAAYKWKPQRLAIEDANGVRWLVREVYREFQRLNVRNLTVEYIPIGNRKSASKEAKAAPVKRLFDTDRFILSNGIPQLDAVYDELELFPDGQHDDIVSSFSLLIEHFSQTAEAIERSEFHNFDDQVRQRQIYDRIYGLTNAVVNRAEDIPAEVLPLSVTYSPLSEFQ
jgi:phage terminase large subunit-like protein